ncbi:tetratricopeptide repeat protein [Coxiella burnetii]|uniref:Type 4 pili biogenesis protein n=1 Tax=Coxiella burnetii (strain Dugway 5J108-111) TaxID=434922 RepID=A9KB76_COXBN|nr:tetratricopeptide repeat protein [Coxiella burnetii]ABS78036.2 type 4 pili biogenesis protein [Coxiella burnetii Dugway 5J108-111]ACJ19472.1 type 4 pili biogenesis protein [Coxiella burnetii CbuK_Q154]OYK81147.1 fimbrial protein [Coxiella burnetii]OYK83238.1 fimbrial protein [Coxiella burnetii]PHH58034.1 fimbrial protein [Coxiella burnetii]
MFMPWLRFLIIFLMGFAISACEKSYSPLYSDANVYLTIAYYEEQKENTDLANSYYQRAVDSAPNSARVHNNYGVFLCRQKRYKAAIEQFVVASKINYKYRVMAYQNMSLCKKLLH